ncbi:hypothetical protein PGTUg99_027278 [Puccinia graminis f. sp. tritici]|uniref:Uncharacterized protein n=1 Tax=Puccinia graminis f. sp. tritici TaxID=56615 RepID=A0A5B0RZL6_PUCGR|nr:hypothetical protein PGTUg99_027278 [Puccinia graminis f. sp. tritici]
MDTRRDSSFESHQNQVKISIWDKIKPRCGAETMSKIRVDRSSRIQDRVADRSSRIQDRVADRLSRIELQAKIEDLTGRTRRLKSRTNGWIYSGERAHPIADRTGPCHTCDRAATDGLRREGVLFQLRYHPSSKSSQAVSELKTLI